MIVERISELDQKCPNCGKNEVKEHKEWSGLGIVHIREICGWCSSVVGDYYERDKNGR